LSYRPKASKKLDLNTEKGLLLAWIVDGAVRRASCCASNGATNVHNIIAPNSCQMVFAAIYALKI